MLGGITDFFSHFQERDWATFSLALFAAAVSVVTLVRSYLNHHQTLLKEQADFVVTWRSMSGRDLVWAIFENTGTAQAYNVQAAFNVDPEHLFGLAGGAQGPVRPGEQFSLGSEFKASSFQHTQPPMLKEKGFVLIIDWIDQFGVPRRKKINHETFPYARLPDDEQYPGIPNEKAYASGQMGSAEYFDPRWPRQRRAWKRRAQRDG